MTQSNIQQIDTSIKQNWGALDILADPIVGFSATSLSLVYMNKAAIKLDEATCSNGVDPNSAPHILGLTANALRANLVKLFNEETHAVQFSVDHFDYHFDVSLQLDTGSSADPIAIAVFRDVTKQYEADRQRHELVSNVSHELRSPLTAIKGAMGLIQSGAAGEIPDRAKQMVDICHRNADRLVLIINDILDLDKITAGAMPFDNRDVRLSMVVKDAVDAIEGYKNRFDVGVDVEIIDPDVASWVDPNRMVQVLVNLLSNAIKFSPKGDSVLIRLTSQGDLNRLSVIDNGDGIPDEHQGDLFGRFVQLGSKNRATTGGTGLGLSIVKAIVINQGGKISFESKVGVGTTFHVDLPKTIEEQPATEPGIRSI